MAETFLHGVDVIDVDSGIRPISTVRSSVIGIVGTAPDSQAEVKASLQTGVVSSNTGITFTSKLLGSLGNKINIAFVNPGTASAALSVSVSSQTITVNLATDASKAVTTTAAQVITAITGNTAAAALVTVAATGASTGAGVVAALRRTYLAGGIDEAFPLDTPVLIAGDQTKAALLGASGTLPDALKGIFDQTGAVVVVVRVTKGVDDTATQTNVIGGVNVTTGKFSGLYAFLGSESVLGFCPKILIAPGFTHQFGASNTANPVVAAMVGIANRLRAHILKDGPSTNDADAIKDRGFWGSRRVFIVDPAVKITDANGSVVIAPNSARAAGLIAKVDNEIGFWASPSNQEISGIVGTERSIDFTMGDSSSAANLLNEQEVATIIRYEGFRLWGNRTCSSDPKWAFLCVSRTADMINESILRAHLWAVDKGITKTYLEDVVDGVNAYLRSLVARGAIIDGKCWADPALNTPDQIMQGKATFSFDFGPYYPAEHITFRSSINNNYLEELF